MRVQTERHARQTVAALHRIKVLPQELHLFEPMRFGIRHATLVTAAIRPAGQAQRRPRGPPRGVRLAPQTLGTRVDGERLDEEQQHRDVYAFSFEQRMEKNLAL